ncbi:hypothetical protein [Nesterenkonia natronophila]|uniref:Uncharacterized protein n=1 Tax=Nesterenkonia natronophila TaxID=2174932 RepID=A0A3A4FI20_9MICC|nr:hypothetical protein [Nesterenkonia natronophila]RJN31955.1 hypothetical protein D3250_07555 [Nesterenkonia natronophila]
MAAKLILRTDTERFTAEMPTPQCELIATIIGLRLGRGLPTPFLMESADGDRSQHLEITTAGDYSVHFGPEGGSTVPTERLVQDATESDQYIDDGGYIRVTTEDL